MLLSQAALMVIFGFPQDAADVLYVGLFVANLTR
jgi:hypothetical protein